ncbi:DNA primase [Flavobacterium columnare]|uniref:DNA primase n=1 Tax=Flavobacterium columnare (strain ATCC 49512 / CIP 103533 / TG 44/87) TaxID=1041826 RepID=G8X6P1_FLACA|nr:DNA primase [Flavobacterium columnare]AEW85626.1 DNA primase [Flavobacterium columnare ATCC 49512]ANO47446.1 DNA primase [Flavobacterium columnare]APT21911.1 DNA primase [Flavobacterium columnare]OOB82901.1 DNA primase [Flavobacterium columnare]PDS23962.1 DNA primase [Flavobacterium columnare] [Flavobacterium columnare NBRC 100251 = ATCC 23463]
MISKNTIETVFETARVEEVIGDFVQLKRAGTNLKGLSPFSDEKSPSFMVSPVKQIWKDFSSGKGGNAVTFLMEHEHFSYPEAIRYLAKKYNIEIEETEQSTEEVAVANEKESMYLVSEFAQKFFQDKMLHTNEGQAIGLSYFKERGFTLDTIKKFGLGFSPEGWDVFTKEALEKGYKLEFLEKTGLTITKEDGRHFDRFKGRVMFPIQSMSGRVLGFGGRILINDKKVAKYVNSPESEIYHKSKVLYGIYYAKQAIAKQDNCFLCEGYTDVIQMHQAGIENVVASSGTALTPDQIRLINRLTKNVTVLFDGDAAGLRASIRGIDLILEEGMNVKVCTFPDGDDPDSFARKTPHDDLLRYLDENAMDFIQFKASLLMKEAKNDPIKKADLIRDMVISIAKIPDRIKREVYIKECSRIMDISEEVLFNTLAQLVQKDITESNKKLKQEQKAFTVVKNEDQSAKSKIDVQYQLERKIIEILLLYGNAEEEFTDYLYKATPEGELKEIKELNMYKVYQRIYLSLQEDEVELANPLFRAIYNEVMNYYHQNEKFEIEHFLMQLTPELAQEVTSILMEDEKMNLHNWEVKLIYVKLKDQTIGQYVTETILSLRWFLVNKIIEEVKGQLSPDPQADNSEILYMVMDYSKLVGNFSSKLGRVMSRYS